MEQSAPPARGATPPTCPDCPPARQEVFAELVPGANGTQDACRFRCLSLDARSPLPARWFGAYAIGLVRRGVLVRQRVDAQGRATAIDAAGPGALFVLADPAGWRSTSAPSGYAATSALVCLCPGEMLENALAQPGSVGRDLVRLQAQALERIERIADARGRATVQSRVAALVCTLADTLSPTRARTAIPSGLLQRDLANLVSIRHETVCRALRALEKKKVVKRSRDGLEITGRALLESM